MEIEKIPKQIWLDIVSGAITCEYEYLALKILLSRVKMVYRMNPSPDVHHQGVQDLKNLFIKSQNIPSAQRDFQKIVLKGGV